MCDWYPSSEKNRKGGGDRKISEEIMSNFFQILLNLETHRLKKFIAFSIEETKRNMLMHIVIKSPMHRKEKKKKS